MLCSKTAEGIAKYEENTRLTPELGDAILRLYKSEVWLWCCWFVVVLKRYSSAVCACAQAVSKTYARRAEFWILDSCDYYFQHIARFCDPDYVPTEEDALLARVSNV